VLSDITGTALWLLKLHPLLWLHQK
jgi:hypothetical protein